MAAEMRDAGNRQISPRACGVLLAQERSAAVSISGAPICWTLCGAGSRAKSKTSAITPNEACDVRVTVGQTVLETRLGAWMARIRGGVDVSGSEEGKSSEVVIIRRRSGEDEGKHHGGVWKIAYADFMTAMMAFFLVMWLINSTDKKTLTQVATYFNPMRLTDKKPNPKGLHEPDAAESNDKVPGKDKAAPKNMKGKDSVSKGATKHDESEVGEVRSRGTPFQHGNETSEDNRSGSGGETERNVPQTTGRAFRDPFDPAFRTEIAPNERVGGLAERSQQPAPKAPGAQVVRDQASDAGQLQPSEVAKGAMKDAAGDGRDLGKDAREAGGAAGRDQGRQGGSAGSGRGRQAGRAGGQRVRQ